MSKFIASVLSAAAVAACATSYANNPGYDIGTPVKSANLDQSTYQCWDPGTDPNVQSTGGVRDAIWTADGAIPSWYGTAFGGSREPGERHLRIGFIDPVAVGSILVRGNVRVGVLKPSAEYPGDLADDSQWIDAERLDTDGVTSAEPASDDYRIELWTLPGVVETRALRFTHDATADMGDFSAHLAGCVVLSRRYANYARFASVASKSNNYMAERICNGSDDGWNAWENASVQQAASRMPVSEDNPEWLTLYWPSSLKIDAIVTCWTGMSAIDVQSFVAGGVVDGVATATWTTDRPVGGRIWYGETSAASDGVTDYEPAPVTDHSVVIEGLVPGRTYYAVAEAGGVRSDPVSFDYLVDTPAISRVVVSTDRFGEISATWETDAKAIGWIECSPVAGGASVRSDLGAYGTSHSATVTGLDGYEKYIVTIRSNASSVSRTVRTRRVGAFTCTFEDPIFHSTQDWPNQGFATVDVEPYDLAGGMTHPTYALRRSHIARNDTTVNQASGYFPTQYAFVFVHSSEYGVLEIQPPDTSVTEPLYGTDRNVRRDPWTFSFDAAFANQFFDDPNFSDGYAYVNLLSNRMNPGDELGTILSFQLAPAGNDFVVFYRDGDGVVRSAMLVEDLAIMGTGTTKVYHFEFRLDMEARTFDAYVDGRLVASGLGFHSAAEGSGIAGFQASGGGVYGSHALLLDNISLVGGSRSSGVQLLLQ